MSPHKIKRAMNLYIQWKEALLHIKINFMTSKRGASTMIVITVETAPSSLSYQTVALISLFSQLYILNNSHYMISDLSD